MKKRHKKAYHEYKEALKQKNYEIALKKLEYLYTEDEENKNIKTIAKHELVNLCKKTDNIDKGINYFENLLKNPIDKEYATLKLGELEEYNKNFSKAKNYYKELLNTKLKRFALVRLASLEEKLGNYTEAIKYYEMLKVFEAYRKRAFLKLFILNMKIKNYDETLKYLEKIIDKKLLSSKEINYYFTYLKYKMGITGYKTNKEGYLINQIKNYNQEEAINHIEKRHKNQNISQSVFSKNLNISKLYKNIKENFDNMTLIETGICDKYIYDTGFNIGTANDENTSFIQVVTICNTQDIITMFPVHQDINYKNNIIRKKNK